MFTSDTDRVIQEVSDDFRNFWVVIWWLPITAPLIVLGALSGALNLYRGDQRRHMTSEREIDRYIAACKSQIT